MSLNSEDEVKKALDIDSWRNLSKDKVIKFAAMMPDMSKEVRIKIIEQFPKFKELALDALNVLEKEHASTLASNAQSQTQVHNAYEDIRKVIKDELKPEDLSEEYRRFLIEQLVESGQKEFEKDTENKKFLDGLFNKGLMAVGGIVAASLVFVGGKVVLQHGNDSE